MKSTDLAAKILLSLLLVSIIPVNGNTTIKIMPLGDSITQGDEYGGYRQKLYIDLTNAGFSVDFVGSLSWSLPNPSYDTDHEGHSGWHADQIRDEVYDWLVENPADIVLLHIGTNDISYGDENVAEVADILDNVDQYEIDHSMDITVILARIILRTDDFDMNETTKAFNDAVEDMALIRIANGDDIIIVDMENALTYPDDMVADDEHPNAVGYEKMADVWYNAIYTKLITNGPIADFTGSPTSGTEQLTVTFTDASTSSDGIDSWLWNFGDGQTSDEQNPIHTYNQGTYTVTLTVTEADADTDTETKTGYITATGQEVELFSDGFESGDFTQWDGIDNNISPTVETDTSHHGTYSMSLEKSAPNHYGAVYKTFSAQSEVYGRAYYTWNVNPSPGTQIRFMAFKCTGSGSTLFSAGLRNNGGTIQWYIKYLKNGATGQYETYDETPTIDAWISLELHVVIDGSAGKVELYRNGELIISDSDFDTNDYGNVNLFKVGADYETSAYPVSSYTDCAVVSNQYIGPEDGGLLLADFVGSPTSGTEPLTVTFTDASTSSDGIDYWLWTFGDGETSTAENPTHDYYAGTYTVSLTVTESDGDFDTETKTDYITANMDALDNFIIIALPDTQHYSEYYPEIFDSQTRWIVNNVDGINIVFVSNEGDIVQEESNIEQWERADDSFTLLDGVVPWAVIPGNHDGVNVGEPGEDLTNYSTYFPYNRFNGQPWYGGAYNDVNSNSYELFSGGYDDYLIFHFQYHPSDAVLMWAESILANYPNRRVLVTTHDYLDVDGSRTSEGNHIWNNFVAHHSDQIFLVLCGHMHGEARRTDVVNGHTVYQVLADYQSYPSGGEGWLRMLDFRPAEDRIYVKSYSPYLNQYQIDADSQFTLDYDMTSHPEIPSYSLNVNVVGNGSVALVPDLASYLSGSNVSLSASADAGYEFSGWSGDLSGSVNPESIIMDGNKTVTATFSLMEKVESYLVVRGLDDGIYYRLYNSGEETWGNWITLPGSTCDSPASVVYNDKLYLVVRGMDGNSLWFGSVDLSDNSFSGWSYLSGATPSKPTLVCWENGERLVMVVRGTDNRIYHRYYDLVTESWQAWIAIPTGTTIDSPAAAIDGDYLHLVVRGMDDGLYHQKVYLSTFDIIYFGWNWISGTTPSAPTLTSNFKTEGDDNLIYLIVRGSDNGIYMRSYDGRWSGWTSLPGSTNDTVGACIQPSKPDSDAALHIVVRGMTGGLYHGTYDLNSESFLGWAWISGETPSPPILTS